MASLELAPQEIERGLQVAKDLRVAIFVVAYNAEAHIEATLNRIPKELLEHIAEVYVVDDESRDETASKARALQEQMPSLKVFRTPYNQGYGGNQKIGYGYAIEQDFDVVVLLHGDGQYAPEVLPRLLAPFADPDTAAVFGSRMMVKGAARAGGMPLYKRIGNAVLTFMENRLLSAGLSEFHSGYRAYRVSALADMPFQYNTNDFHFDTEIIIQLLGTGRKIVEVPIPTYYGDEICHVNGVGYAWNCILTILRAKANQIYLVYHPKYDFEGRRADYVFKKGDTTVHQEVLHRKLAPGSKVVELGAGTGDISRELAERGMQVLAIDAARPVGHFGFPFVEADLEAGFEQTVRDAFPSNADMFLALDVIEHLRDPEQRVAEIHSCLHTGGLLVASTGNIAYLPLRLMMLLGQFNYGKKGILDLTHVRLFSVGAFKRLLEGEGFAIRRVQGFGPPILDMVGRSWWLRAVDRLSFVLANAWPSMFAYQFLVDAERLDSVQDLMAQTFEDTQELEAPEPQLTSRTS